MSIDLTTVGIYRLRFDVDQQDGYVGTFDIGNAQLLNAACEPNAYRGSDLLTGLVYAGTELATGCPVTLGATTGWTAVAQDVFDNPSIVDFSFQSFDDGKAFVFEADTDFGPKSAEGLTAAEVTITTNLATYGPATLFVYDENTTVLVLS